VTRGSFVLCCKAPSWARGAPSRARGCLTFIRPVYFTVGRTISLETPAFTVEMRTRYTPADTTCPVEDIPFHVTARRRSFEGFTVLDHTVRPLTSEIDIVSSVVVCTIASGMANTYGLPAPVTWIA